MFYNIFSFKFHSLNSSEMCLKMQHQSLSLQCSLCCQCFEGEKLATKIKIKKMQSANFTYLRSISLRIFSGNLYSGYRSRFFCSQTYALCTKKPCEVNGTTTLRNVRSTPYAPTQSPCTVHRTQQPGPGTSPTVRGGSQDAGRALDTGMGCLRDRKLQCAITVQ